MMLPMVLPSNVSRIIETLQSSGFEAYIVGGCVRDMLMGKEPKDWDFATSAYPEHVKELFPKTYDTGLKHGTVTVVLDDERFEITTFRLDGEYTDGRHPENVTFSANIEDDLLRRDFTMNSIADNRSKGYVDPYSGIPDIKAGIIRGVGNADTRFKEDALRMLRAIRFSATLGFEIEQSTKNAIIKNAELIDRISSERIRDEVMGIILSPAPYKVFSEEFLAIMSCVFAPLADALNQNAEIHYKLFENCKRNVIIRLGVLIYFLEKEDAANFLEILKLSNNIYYRVERLHNVQDAVIEPTDYYNVVKKVSEWSADVFSDYLYIQMLKCIAFEFDFDYVSALEENYKKIVDNDYAVQIKDLAVNGFDLNNEFKITGASIGRVLDRLLDFVHHNPHKNSYESLLQEAYHIITKG